MYAGTGSDGKRRYTVAEIAGAFAVSRKTIYRHLDPAIESHYGTGYERSRLFPGGNPALKFVRSMELLDRLLPGPPARLLDVGGGPGSCAHASSELALGGGRDGLIVGGDQVPGRQRFPGRDTHQSVRADPASACCTANMTLALAGSMSAAKWLTNVVLGQPAEALLVGEQVRQCRGRRSLGQQCAAGPGAGRCGRTGRRTGR